MSLNKCINCLMNDCAKDSERFCSVFCAESWFMTRMHSLVRIEAMLDTLLDRDEDIKDAKS